MTINSHIVAAALLIGAPAAAMAEGAADWQGAYIGLHATSSSLGYTDERIPGHENQFSSEFVGGYNFALSGNWVMSAEAGVSVGDTAPYDPSTGAYGFAGRNYVHLRAGYATGNMLIYGGLGAAQGNIDVAGSVTYGLGNSYDMFVGGEMRVNDRVSVRAQYLRSTADATFFGPGNEAELDQFGIGINYFLK